MQNKLNYQILVISLKDSHERRKRVTKEFLKFEVKWSFLDAINGRELIFPIPEYNASKHQRILGYQLTSTEIGCFLSHRKAWKLCTDHKLITIVIEDDAVIESNFLQVISILLENQNDWDLIRLQGILKTLDELIKEFKEFKIVKNLVDPWGSTAYILKPSMSQILYENSKEIYLAVDHFLEHYKKHKKRLLAVKPYVVTDSGSLSTIEHLTRESSNLKIIKFLKLKSQGVFVRLDRRLSKNPWFPK